MKKLFVLIRQGKLDEVKSIIEKKPELVNCVSGALPKKDHGQSPLQVALKTGKYEIADYLIQQGADLNFMEKGDDDPGLRVPVLFDAINSTITSLCYKRFEESDIAFGFVQKLVEGGADVHKLASNGYDAINWSVSCAELLFNSADIYAESQEAVRSQLTRILDLLMEHGADYLAWAKKGHYAEPYPGPSNKSLFLDDFIPREDKNTDKCRELRLFMQEYFRSRQLEV